MRNREEHILEVTDLYNKLLFTFNKEMLAQGKTAPSSFPKLKRPEFPKRYIPEINVDI